MISVAHAGDYLDLRNIQPIHGDAAAGAAKVTACSACHGPNGNSLVPLFPRLAGQRADYIYYRLLEFKQADPHDPYYAGSPMLAMAAALSETDMRNIASYFALQKSTAATSPAANPSSGEALYLHGDPAKGIPPCQGCHGVNGAGLQVDANASKQAHLLAYPMLRAQHAAYLVSRLTRYRDAMPHATSNDFIMRGVARTLPDDSIQALAEWLASLPTGDAK
jgi:cytochrome c553